MDLGWLWCVSVGSSIDQQTHQFGGVFDSGGECVWGVQKIYGKSCVFPSNFLWI